MATLGGFTGRILRVDLTTGKITYEDTMRYKDYLGGTGLGYKVLWDEITPATKAWDAENRIIFGVGPLTGTGSPLSGRVSITSLMPLSGPYGDLSCTGHMGGHWGAELKFAGWDSIIVQGKSNSPCYIAIEDDRVEIRDAAGLWDTGIFRTTTEVANQCGGGTVQVAAIGQAGARMVRMSNIMNNRSHSAGGGGSVMGSKNLKAIAVKGTGAIPIALSPKEWKDFVYYYLSLIGANNQHVVPTTPQPWAEFTGSTRWNAQPGLPWGAASPAIDTGICSAADLNKMGFRTHKGAMDWGRDMGAKYTVRGDGCHACPIRCHPVSNIPALATKYGVSAVNMNTCVGNSFGTGFFDTLKSNTQASIEASQLGSALADDYGIWNDYGQTPRDFVYAYRKGLWKAYLDEKEYASVPWDKLDNGDPAFLQDIMRRWAFKEGKLGEALADGSNLLEQKIPEMADAHKHESSLNSNKWGMAKHHDASDSYQVGMLCNLIYNRDCMCHTHTNFLGNGLPLDIKKEIGAELFGNGDAVDATSDVKPMTEAKAVFARMSLVYMELHNSLTCCNWGLPVWASPLKERKYRGDVELEAKAYSAVTGEQTSRADIEAKGMKILHLFRALTVRQMNQKDQRNKHDEINDWYFEYPKDKQAFTPGTYKMDRADMEKGKDLFYGQMGWDVATGVPTRKTLEGAGLKDVADALDKAGLLPA